jgi:uncharacterized phiE125 gp8 family phage protein
MTLRLITPATAPVVTVDEAKAHLRLDTTGDDTLVAALLIAATEAAEHATGRALATQTWETSASGFPSGGASSGFPSEVRLTRVPVLEIVSISYVDLEGVEQTLAPAAYHLTRAEFDFAYVTPAFGTEWPQVRGDVDGVKVRFTAGYADAASVPQSVKQWVLLQVGSMYENREAETMAARIVPNKLGFVDALLARYKVWA